MILYVNGDSNSAGAELLNQEKSWANLLARRLGVELINQSAGGGSNDRILRTTNNFINNDEPKSIFMIIGWTSWEREEWQFNNQYYNVNAGGYDQLPSELIIRYKEWVALQSDNERGRKSHETHKKIFQLHEKCTQQKIPHLFFNALMSFHFETPQVDWNQNYYKPYDCYHSYYWYLKNAGYQETKNFHHSEDAQAHWADVMYNYIIKNNLL